MNNTVQTNLVRSSEDEDLAFVLQKPRSFNYEHRPKPAFRCSRDVVVKVIATGLCGSDVSIPEVFPSLTYFQYVPTSWSNRSITGNMVASVLTSFRTQ